MVGRYKRLFIIALGLLLSLQGSGNERLQAQSFRPSTAQYTPAPRYALDRVIVKFKEGSLSIQALSRVKSQYKLQTIKQFKGLNIHVFKLPADKVPHEIIAELSKRPDVEYVEPDYIYTLKAIPNDPGWGYLWGLQKIQVPLAWDLTQGSSNVVVAVIDSGVDYNHNDLKENMWINGGEVPNNGVDDDSNGYVDDYYGINAINGSGNPMDDNGHGTHVAGIIGAVGNNGVGVVGVNWHVKIMALKFANQQGEGYTSDAIECINYAIQKGAHIINASWGDYYYSQALKDAIEMARNAGILFVAAAGNENNNNDLYPFYPASYDLENIISVAATDQKDLLAGFSNYGRNSVHVGAPGVEILSTWLDNRYAYADGTSMAAPYVAGLAALLKAQNPSYTWRDLKCRIMKSVDPLDSLNSKTITGGRINAYKALTTTDCQGTFYFQYRLTVNKSGAGAGTITSSPAGINCGSQCSAYFNPNTVLTLTATPDAGSTFAGWSGDCTSCGNNASCTITMDANKTCTATFNITSNGGSGGGCAMLSGTSPINTLFYLFLPFFVALRRFYKSLKRSFILLNIFSGLKPK
ncbi:MAG: S8 family serine peptidase [Aquificaceae bacterium]